MSDDEIAFAVFYGVMAVFGIYVVLRHWYYEIYKNEGGDK